MRMVGESAEAQADAIGDSLKWTQAPSMLAPLVRQDQPFVPHPLPESRTLRQRDSWWSIWYNGAGEAPAVRSGVAKADVGIYTIHDCVIVVELAAISSTLLRTK